MSYPPCPCGEPGTNVLYLRYRRPRETFEPDAMDPWYIHGSWPIRTCGSAGCEAEEYARLLSVHPAADIHIATEAGEGFYVAGDSE